MLYTRSRTHSFSLIALYILKVKIFEKASLNLKKMRDDAQALPNEDRKRFAAMVVSTLFPEENFDDI